MSVLWVLSVCVSVCVSVTVKSKDVIVNMCSPPTIFLIPPFELRVVIRLIAHHRYLTGRTNGRGGGSTVLLKSNFFFNLPLSSVIQIWTQ